jgi:hypothetical protein
MLICSLALVLLSSYSKITKLIKMDGLAAEYLDNSANHVTFFAPNVRPRLHLPLACLPAD